MTRRLARPGPVLALLLAGATLVLAGCAGQEPASLGAPGSVEAPVGDTAAGPAPAREQETGAGGVVPAVADDAVRAVVVIGDVAVEVRDVLAATTEVTRLVAAYRGQVDGRSTQTAGTPGPEDDTATLVVRVPPAGVDAFLGDLAALGTLRTADVSRTDVSTEVADVDARVENARASVARVRALLDRAQQLSDIVLLEAEMSRRQADLESLEARARVLADQTSLATLTVRLSGADATVAPPVERAGFLAGLSTGWDAFLAAATGAATVLGVLTPFLLLALLVAGLAVLLAAPARRRRRTAPSAPEA